LTSYQQNTNWSCSTIKAN